MVLKADQLRVKTLLAETITLLCKNGLHFKTKLSIEGLIGITLDDEEIFLVNINETTKTSNSVQEIDEGNNASEQPSPGTKRVRNKAEVVSNKVSSQLSESPASPTVKSSDTGCSIPKIPSNSHTRTLRSSRQTSPPSVAVRPTRPARVPRITAGISGIGALGGSNDSSAEFGNDSLPASSFGLSECESQTFPSARFKTDEAAGNDGYDDRKNLLAEADFLDQPNKRIRQGTSDVVAESLALASTSSQTFAAFTVSKDQAKSEPTNVVEIKEESFSADESQQPNYSAYEEYSNTLPYGSSGADMMHGFADSSVFQANSSFFISQDGVNQNPDNVLQLQQFYAEQSPFKCTECGKRFSSVYSLRMHRKQTHRRDFTYVCNICGKGVHKEKDLRGHMASWHNMPKEFQCPVCSKEFGYERALKRHIILLHGFL